LIGRSLEKSKTSWYRKKAFLIPLAVILVGIIFACAFVFYAKNVIKTPNSKDGAKKIFTVSAGQGAGEVAENLKKEKLIKSPFIFILYLNYKGLGDQVQAGEYEIASNLNMIDVASIITTGKIVTSKITIPEGWTISQIAEYVDKNTIVSKADFLSAAKGAYDYEFLADRPKGASLEGYLYPDTYLLTTKPTAEEIIKKMLDNFDKKYTKEMREKAKTSGMTPFEIVTLASIVEREVSKPEDRKLVAGVFLNRLNADMPLESCTTIQYILGVSKPQFTYEETRTPSPYNTYMNPGLPVGPIGNPSIASIEAVLYPEKSNYYYFLSSKGTTYFSRTLDEHNAKKAQYLD
jgi:UPF0755 protein